MRICDKCKALDKKVLDLKLVIQKPDPENNRKSPEELRSLNLELCQGCIDTVWGEVTAPVLDPQT